LGVSNVGEVVGLSMDAAGNMHGFLATPVRNHHDR
jgi:probable HAF family extracellular repeat protein